MYVTLVHLSFVCEIPFFPTNFVKVSSLELFPLHNYVRNMFGFVAGKDDTKGEIDEENASSAK